MNIQIYLDSGPDRSGSSSGALAIFFTVKDSVMIKINTDSKSLKKAVDSDNSLKDKRTAIAVATLRRCVEFENMEVRMG